MLLLAAAVAPAAGCGVDGAGLGPDARVVPDPDAAPLAPLPADCNLVPAAPPPALGLDPFYQKYIDVGGIPIVASNVVRDAAFPVACRLAVHMLQGQLEARRELIGLGVRVGIIGENQQTTDMPEYRDLNEVYPEVDWDARTRGVGATASRPLSGVGEENLLQLPGDRYVGESIMVHEFAHTIFDLGIARAAGGAAHQATLTQLYADMLDGFLWTETYARSTAAEYWAVAVQSWFGVNLEVSPPNGIHNEIDTRAELLEYDPPMAAFIGQFFVAEDAPW